VILTVVAIGFSPFLWVKAHSQIGCATRRHVKICFVVILEFLISFRVIHIRPNVEALGSKSAVAIQQFVSRFESYTSEF
jgi:hypothetical protein